MFTLDQIKDEHSKVRSGTDFPKYVDDLVTLGVEKYNTYVTDWNLNPLKKETRSGFYNFDRETVSPSIAACVFHPNLIRIVLASSSAAVDSP